ncbi:MAG: hypothetical protein RR382_13545, partial [Tannerellaceae bacterium]
MNLKNTCKQIALITVASLSGLSAIAQPKADIYHDTWTDFNKNGKKDLYEDPAQPVASRVANLLSQMTLEEK